MEAHGVHLPLESEEAGGWAGSDVFDCDIEVAVRTLSRFRSLLIMNMVCLACERAGRRLEAAVLALTVWNLPCHPGFSSVAAYLCGVLLRHAESWDAESLFAQWWPLCAA